MMLLRGTAEWLEKIGDLRGIYSDPRIFHLDSECAFFQDFGHSLYGEGLRDATRFSLRKEGSEEDCVRLYWLNWSRNDILILISKIFKMETPCKAIRSISRKCLRRHLATSIIGLLRAHSATLAVLRLHKGRFLSSALVILRAQILIEWP